jgi:arsenate reductase (glutaredoxin)
MVNVQIFGLKNSQASRAAERFFKERRIAVQYVDLKQKPIAAGEIKRFVDRFGWAALIDSEGAAYLDSGLKYLKLTEVELLARVQKEPRLLRLPLVRNGQQLSAGYDEEAWRAMAPPAR